MVFFPEGVGELLKRGRLLSPVGRVRFHLNEGLTHEIPAGTQTDPDATVQGLREPPNGYVEAVDDDINLRALYYEQASLVLRFDGYEMACILSSPDGDLHGMGGWGRVPEAPGRA
jgi:hypothetical protein